MDEWRSRIVEHGVANPQALMAHPENWRMHPTEQQAALAEALDRVGWVRDVLVNRRTGHVLDGHLRVWLANQRGEFRVPTLYIDVDEDEERFILATLDPIAGMALPDHSKLDAVLKAVKVPNGSAIESLLRSLQKTKKRHGLTDPDAVPERRETTITRGDTFELGDHRLVCGDATGEIAVQRVMQDRRADCVFTSPPYAVGLDYGEYEDTIENLRAMLPRLARLWLTVLDAGGFAVINFGDIVAGRDVAKSKEPCEYPMAVEYWPIFRSAGWQLWSRRIWCKPNARVNALWTMQSNRAASDWEHVWTWKAPGDPILARVNGETPSALGWFDTTQEHGVDLGREHHGAGMAVALPLRMIPIHTREGGIVHEPFCGTGTTMIACEMLGRRCYATEIDASYCQLTIDRWEAFTGRKAAKVDA